MMAACYDLSLQCDAADCKAGDYGMVRTATFTGEHGSNCRKQARAAGWKMWPDRGLCLCPSCAKRGAEPME